MPRILPLVLLLLYPSMGLAQGHRSMIRLGALSVHLNTLAMAQDPAGERDLVTTKMPDRVLLTDLKFHRSALVDYEREVLQEISNVLQGGGLEDSLGLIDHPRFTVLASKVIGLERQWVHDYLYRHYSGAQFRLAIYVNREKLLPFFGEARVYAWSKTKPTFTDYRNDRLQEIARGDVVRNNEEWALGTLKEPKGLLALLTAFKIMMPRRANEDRLRSALKEHESLIVNSQDGYLQGQVLWRAATLWPHESPELKKLARALYRNDDARPFAAVVLACGGEDTPHIRRLVGFCALSWVAKDWNKIALALLRDNPDWVDQQLALRLVDHYVTRGGIPGVRTILARRGISDILPRMKAYLKHQDWEYLGWQVRYEAVKLVAFFPKAEGAREFLEEALRDHDFRVSEVARKALWDSRR